MMGTVRSKVYGPLLPLMILFVALILAGCLAPSATLVPTPLLIATQLPGAHAGHAASNPVLSNTRMIMMDADEFSLSPRQMQIKAGEAITIMFINEGTLDHDVRIDAVNFHAHAEPDRSVEASFVGPEKGEYEIYCGVPGHKGRGMVSKLIVQ